MTKGTSAGPVWLIGRHFCYPVVAKLQDPYCSPVRVRVPGPCVQKIPQGLMPVCTNSSPGVAAPCLRLKRAPAAPPQRKKERRTPHCQFLRCEPQLVLSLG